MGSETVGWGQTIESLEGMLMSKDSTMKNFMRCAKECEVGLVGLTELSYKGVNTVKEGIRETN